MPIWVAQSHLREFHVLPAWLIAVIANGDHSCRRRKEKASKIATNVACNETKRRRHRCWCTEIFLAVPAEADSESVRSFPTFTEGRPVVADWLQRCGVDTVAMESTGVYRIPLFQFLE